MVDTAVDSAVDLAGVTAVSLWSEWLTQSAEMYSTNFFISFFFLIFSTSTFSFQVLVDTASRRLNITWKITWCCAFYIGFDHAINLIYSAKLLEFTYCVRVWYQVRCAFSLPNTLISTCYAIQYQHKNNKTTHKVFSTVSTAEERE